MLASAAVRPNPHLTVREDIPVTNPDAKSPETRHKENYLRRIVPHKKSSQVTAFFYISKKLIFQVRPMLMMVWRSWVMYWVPPL